MGMWDFVKKMATGKPIFEEPPREQASDRAGWVEESSQPAESPSPFLDEHGRKIVPEVRVERCKSHLNGAHMEVTAWLTNVSSFEIELDKMIVRGMRTELDRRLRPNEGHEVTVYKGQQPMDDHDHKAQLYYKIVENGDYFCADFMIEYNRESSGMFTIEEFHPDHIVHDV
jgi:hypothetical protein